MQQPAVFLRGGRPVWLSASGRGPHLQPWIYPERLLLKLHASAAVPSRLLTPDPCISAATHFMHHDKSLSPPHGLIYWQQAVSTRIE